ncbi:unnamed protein product [Lymnaea stagnalis]|uniref:Heparan-sulfate 6-O-sulfotransferase n=1 Tax=Lymnaea stagnalis TaxID=6523 RepID=A0AAV2IFX5_LYMST
MTSLSNLLTQEAVLETPCSCRDQMTKCKCLNKHGQPWLFHSFNTTGYVCGEFADFTTLNNCPIDRWFKTSGRDPRPFRRYFLVTMLREPMARYLSEWLHTRDEDTFFKNEPRLYRNISLELQKKGLACYLGIKLSNLPLLDFIRCKENSANNRQTRMLANLAEVNALRLRGQAYDEALLKSAKQTLLRLPFYGILDRLDDTMVLLEAELGFHFRQPLHRQHTASETLLPLEPGMLQLVQQANHLDLKLFQFATKLFDDKLSKKIGGHFQQKDNLITDNTQVENNGVGLDENVIRRKDVSETSENIKFGRRKRNEDNGETLNEHGSKIGDVQEHGKSSHRQPADEAALDNYHRIDADVVSDFLGTLEQLKKERQASADGHRDGQSMAAGSYGRSRDKALHFNPEKGQPDHDTLNGVINTRVRGRTRHEKDVDRMFM